MPADASASARRSPDGTTPSSSSSSSSSASASDASPPATPRSSPSSSSTCSDMDIEDDQLHTWAICPIQYSRAALITGFIALYALTFLFYAQHHIVVLLVMTSLIAFWVICLFTSGTICVLYMMLRIRSMESAPHNDAEPKLSTITMVRSTRGLQLDSIEVKV